MPLPDVTGHGFGSVEQMLRTPGATWAHRNLGGTYPEMTEYGVRMAVNAGYGVVEISCQRSRDGTWWGAHDATPSRVAVERVDPGLPFSALTDARIGALHVGVGATGGRQPFATLRQLLGTLPVDAVYLVDPKHSGLGHMSEFLDVVDALAGPSRAIIKLDGTSPAASFRTAQGRGYLTAGYFYATPAPATPPDAVAAVMPHCDLPGLNHDATPAGWAEFLAHGKPMWGHVCATQDDADAALAKGASFIQSTSIDIAAVGPRPRREPSHASPESRRA